MERMFILDTIFLICCKVGALLLLFIWSKTFVLRLTFQVKKRPQEPIESMVKNTIAGKKLRGMVGVHLELKLS